ncbi:SprT-like domain-containing protein [uncultured Pedobacter sp.]|uniref:SprT-like domain-containing protein n=1 Tax=uncultured Pedobacter sp. TaxID=246139 RepID=UPI0025CCE222|nr:SprT-like domain-containing protein [uncultured Pedobacter sp.]
MPELFDKNGKPVNGKTTGYNYNAGIFTCSIILNESALSNAIQEYTVATIIHESLHAYLQYKAGNTLQHGQNHEEISKDYIVPFVNIMKSIYPDLDLKDATALAWGGVQGTSLWNESYKNNSFKIVGTTEVMDFSTIKGLDNAHYYGIADNSTPPCPKK